VYIVAPNPVYAYLDPGAGSYIFQLLVAGVVGLGFLLKLYWERIRGFVKFLFSAVSPEANEDDEQER
jgi:hypothetical protein